MQSHAMAVFLVTSFTALSPAAGHPSSPAASASAISTPAPSVSFVSNSPVLIQQSVGQWITSIVVDVYPSCLDISYKLVTTSPTTTATGRVMSTTPLGPYGRDGAGNLVKCGTNATIQGRERPTAQAYEVKLAFPVHFTTVPLAATLVLSNPRGLATIPSITLTLQRQVTLTQYLMIPVYSGVAMMFLFIIFILLFSGMPRYTGPGGVRTRPRRQPFWKRPVFASAAWSFKDSWALAGATVTLPAGTSVQHGSGTRAISSPATVTIPPGNPDSLSLSKGWIALPGDGTIILSGDVEIGIGVPVSLPGAPPGAPRALRYPPKTIHVEKNDPITVGKPGGTLKIVGVADVTLPAGTEISTPTGAPKLPQTVLANDVSLKIPTAGNVIQAELRSVILAALVTMFGIGAQLGILGVLSFYLSAESGPARWAAVMLLALVALIVGLYAGLTTRAMADARPGSALSASATSFTY